MRQTIAVRWGNNFDLIPVFTAPKAVVEARATEAAVQHSKQMQHHHHRLQSPSAATLVDITNAVAATLYVSRRLNSF